MTTPRYYPATSKTRIIAAVFFYTLTIFASIGVESEHEWTDLLDHNLSKWETWIGIPHSTVTGLPNGTFQSDNVHKGNPMGLNNDQKSVFSVIEENKEKILHISGEIYGGLTSLKSYKNYHFQTQIKWGEKKWEPRLKEKRDSGILYHCHGKHGAFWNTWKSCLECQIQEKDMGDFIPLGGTKATFRGKEDGKRKVFDPTQPYTNANGYMHCRMEPDLPNGEWNTIDVYVYEDCAIHVVNGVPVMAVKDALDKNGKKLVEGQIQIQSEAAECFYRNIRIKPISKLPEDLKEKVNL